MEGVDVRADPVRQRLRPARLGIREVRRAQGRNEDVRLMHLARRRVGHPDRVAGPVDEQSLARQMRLPHRRRDRLLPDLVQLAEPRVAVAVRVLGQILLPQQRQGHAAPLQLDLDRWPVDGRTGALAVADGRKQPPIKLGIIDPVRNRPADPGRLRPAHIFGRLRLADAGCLADLPVAQSKCEIGRAHV